MITYYESTRLNGTQKSRRQHCTKKEFSIKNTEVWLFLSCLDELSIPVRVVHVIWTTHLTEDIYIARCEKHLPFLPIIFILDDDFNISSTKMAFFKWPTVICSSDKCMCLSCIKMVFSMVSISLIYLTASVSAWHQLILWLIGRSQTTKLLFSKLYQSIMINTWEQW